MFKFCVMWNEIILDPHELNVDINDATGVVNIIINTEILVPVVNYHLDTVGSTNVSVLHQMFY